MATASQSSSYDDQHQHKLSSTEMPVKRRWSAWKRAAGAVQPKPDEDHDANLWDNNDTAFVQEVALERHHQKLGIPTHYSENAVEEMRSVAETQAELSARAALNSTSSRPSSSSLAPPSSVKRPSSVAARLSGSGSDNSSTFTHPSPGSSGMDLHARYRPGSSRFSGSHEASPTTASFGSSGPSPTFDCSHEGWTEEPVDVQTRELQPVAPAPVVERRPPRRPSTSSAAFASPSAPTKTWTREDTIRPTDFKAQATPESVKSKVYSSNTLKTPPSTSSKRSSFVSSLKKLGGSLRSSTLPKTSPKHSPSFADKASPTRSTTIATTTDEVQIVSANARASTLPTASPPAISSHFGLSDRSTPMQTPADWRESRTMSESGHYRRPSHASEHDMSIGRGDLGSRIFNRSLSGGLSRNSSLTSNHQSLSSGARGPSGTFNMVDWSVQKEVAPHDSHDEEREELRGDCSPRSGSPRQSVGQLPTRPTRYHESLSGPPSVSSFSTRASLEQNFNAAHDTRWSTAISPFQSERTGSEQSTSGTLSRRASNASSHHTSKGLYNQGHHDSVTSITSSRRTSWQKNTAFEGLGLGQNISAQPMPSTRRSSLGRHTSQKASQLVGRPSSRKQSASSLPISRPTSLVSTTSDLASADDLTPQHSQDHLVGAVDTVSKNDQHTTASSVPAKLLTASRSPRSAGAEAKRPTFGLDLQPDAAAAFDSIPCPRPLRVRTSSTPALAGLSIVTDGDCSMLGGSGISNDGFPRTPDGEEDDSRDGLERRDQSKDGLGSRSDLSSPRRPLSDAPESPVLEELELLDDQYSPNTSSHDSMTKSTTIDTPLDFHDSLRSIDAYTNNNTLLSSSSVLLPKMLTHSRSQEHFHWNGKPIASSQIPRYDSTTFMSRPRSSSYTYV